MMESSIVDFHQDFYIPAIQKLVYQLTYVRILRMHYCGKPLREAFNHCSDIQDVLCRFDYAERVVVRFAHQIKYEYYGGNMYVSIEGVALEHFSATDQ